jgi:hypothetical protein
VSMKGPLADAGCARLPAHSLAGLAGLRAHPGVRVRQAGEDVWVYWPAGDDEVVVRVLGVPGARPFVRRGGYWYAPGASLPEFGVPEPEDTRPLSAVLFPEPVSPEPPGPPAWAKVTLRLVRDGRPRASSALRCTLRELLGWAQTATSRRLAALEGALCGEEVLVRGGKLPEVAGGRRYWGAGLLVPLGWRPEPALGEQVLREALGVGEGEVGVLEAGGVEIIPREAFGRVSRAGLRLAAGEGAP